MAQAWLTDRSRRTRMKVSLSIGGKKKRRPAATFGGTTEEDEAKQRALAVQRQRANEMGLDAAAARTQLHRPAAADKAAPEAAPAKKAADYSSLMAAPPTECVP